MLAGGFQHEATRDWAASADTAAEAAEIGERFGDADLLALAVMSQGRALITRGGRGWSGAVGRGHGGSHRWGVVTHRHRFGLLQRDRGLPRSVRAESRPEWTAAPTRWCEDQPDMVAFTGRCLLHRAEIMELQGAWRDALEEAQRLASVARR